MNEVQLRKLIREAVKAELKNYKSNMLNESALALFTILANTLATLVATGKGKDLLLTPYEIYEKFRNTSIVIRRNRKS